MTHPVPRQEARATPPRVSIGLPVFNGARYVADAIGSILDQDVDDLELIIQDNASTDATGEICAGFAARDPRVRYARNARNLGAAANYNLCFAAARGEFFKWAAHDDALAPGYLRQTIAALDAAPDAVLCTTGIAEIDEDGAVLRRYVNRFPGIDAASPARRFGAAIHTRHQCEEFFGLYRRAALEGSELHGAYNGSDRVLLAQIALRGPWVTVPAPLFLHREHAGRYTRAILLKDRREAALWQDPTLGQAPAAQRFHSLVYRRYLALVARERMTPEARAACYAELLRWWFTDDHAIDVLRDVLKRYPALQQQARALKHRIWGAPAPRPGSLPPLG